MKAIDPNQVHEYILEGERAGSVQDRTVWKLRAPSAQAERECALAGKDSVAHEVQMVLRHCLVGWDNFTMQDGKPAPFTKSADGQPSEATLSQIHFSIKVELCNAARNLGTSQLSEAERKN